VDRLVTLLVNDKEISSSEGSKLKKEITSYTGSLKNWVRETTDRRINEVLGVMNLASKDNIADLSKRIDNLNRRLKKLENDQQKKKQ
jgi:polyhydroxyalkanoate synthesis regulator phasin